MSRSDSALFKVVIALVLFALAVLTIIGVMACICVALILPPLIAVTQWRAPRTKEYWLVVAATTTTLVLGSLSAYHWYLTGNPQYAVSIFTLYSLGALAYFFQKNCEEIQRLDALCAEF